MPEDVSEPVDEKFRTSRKLAQVQGAMIPYCSRASLLFCVLSISLTFSSVVSPGFFSPFWTEISRFIAGAEQCPVIWSHVRAPLGAHCNLPAVFSASASISGVSSPPEQNPSAWQLFEFIRGSWALAIYQHFKIVFVRGQVVCQLLYITWSVVFRFLPIRS